jgi:hypothetical protein
LECADIQTDDRLDVILRKFCENTDSQAISAESTNCVTVTGTGLNTAPLTPSLKISTATGNLAQCTTEGLFVEINAATVAAVLTLITNTPALKSQFCGIVSTCGVGITGSNGVSGTSGTSGAGFSGTSGESGTSGTSGIVGGTGTSGTSGGDGTSGTSGSSGTNGNSSSGTSGTSGSSGSSGMSGSSGSSGQSGTSGSAGTNGSSGQQDPETATLNFDSYQVGQFNYSLSDPIYSTNVVITDGLVNGGAAGTCDTFDDNDGHTNPATITAGTTTASVAGTVAMSCAINVYRRTNSLTINGTPVTNGSTLMIGGTLVTVTIDPVCDAYAC